MNQNHLIAVITLFSFVVQPVGAQTNTAGTIGNIASNVSSITSAMGSLPGSVFPQNGAMPLQLQNATKALQVKMEACQVGSQADSLLKTADQFDGVKKYQDQLAAAKAASALKHGKTPDKKGPAGGCYDDKYAGGSFDEKNDCELTCASPGKEEPTCSDFFDKNSQVLEKAGQISCWKARGSTKDDEFAGLKHAMDKYETYATYMRFKAKSCATKKLDDYKKQMTVFNCEMTVLGQAVGQASNLVQSSLTANNAQYGKMNQFQQELGSQISQIDEILGGDDIGKTGAGGQFSGLLGLQKQVHGELESMNTQQATFQTGVAQLQQGTTANEQTLVSEQMQVVSSCLNGETNLNMTGAYSLTCRKARQVTSGKDASGNPITSNATNASGAVIYDQQSCSPVDFMKSEVEANAYNSSRGVTVTEARKQRASQNVLAMGSLMQSILRDLGQFDQATDAGKLVTNATTWSQIESKYGSAMDSLGSTSGIDVRGQLRSIGGHCMNESTTWKRQQQLSSASNYNKKKTELASQQASLAAQINTGMSSLNKDYADMAAALTGQVVTANRYSCTTTDPASMLTCYTSMRQNAQDLLEGNSTVPFTAKAITGGTMVAGFTVPCRGIDGCVTSFKAVRDAQKKQSNMAQQQKTKFVNDSNQQVQTQVQGFAQFLSGVQNVVLNQFNNMKNVLTAMNVSGPEQPKYMDPESLQAADGPNHEAGPYKAPNKMAAVLSGMVQPTGLIDFNAPGVQDGMKDAAEKVEEVAKGLKEKADKADENEDKLAQLEKTCLPDDPNRCKGSGSVENFDAASSCKEVVATCQKAADKMTADKSAPLSDQLSTIMSLVRRLGHDQGTDKFDDATKNVGSMKTALSAVDGAIAGCKEIKDECDVSSNSKDPNATDSDNPQKVDVKFGS